MRNNLIVMLVQLTKVSRNEKTGPIPVSTSEASTCPDACPFKASGVCYAKNGPLRYIWAQVSDGRLGGSWDEFLLKVRKMPKGQLWRHNQAGDLPGEGDTLDTVKLRELVEANRGRNGFTYTHKPLRTAAERDAVREANANGFTVSLSGNDLSHADTLADMGIGPVVTVLPEAVQGNVRGLTTPAGRRVVVCPATYRDDVSCATCQLCQRANRSVIVGFPVHGARRRKYEKLENINLVAMAEQRQLAGAAA
jgi:hypothetical protein